MKPRTSKLFDSETLEQFNEYNKYNKYLVSCRVHDCPCVRVHDLFEAKVVVI